MSPVRYVFISDQGRVFSSSGEPTTEDFGYAAVGMVTILSLSDGCYYGVEREWLPIPAGRLGAAEVANEPMPPFHAPASYFAEAQSKP